MNMDLRHHGLLHARAEFYLCLARAFQVPQNPALAEAMRDALADDLADLAATLGWDIDAALRDYRAQMRALPDAVALLQVYSALFLVPPVAARINPGCYLDGAVNGGSVKAVEAAYAACGLARDEGFHDLDDHLALQLEFVAWLYASQARGFEGDATAPPPPIDPGRFLHDHAAHWLAPFCADLARADAEREVPANPYLPLARMLAVAVAADAVAPEIDAKAARKQHAIEQARAKAAARGIGDEDLAEIRRKLAARGLSTDHVAALPQWHRQA